MLLDFLTLRCPLSLSPSKKRKKKINSFDFISFFLAQPNKNTNQKQN
ncbi:hypothetical protein NC652_007774 [Populus alba x Populus x berolinensis]|nr:hypothetical protein NC652_007774 [Populus alba x Populus x berolinensis]